MFLDEMTRKDRAVIGFDLENDNSQISYCYTDKSMPDTVSLVMGEEQYNIPTVLCRKKTVREQVIARQSIEPVTDVPQVIWTIGNDALEMAKKGEGTLVEDIVLLARNGVRLKVEDDEYDAEELLEIFVKRVLALTAGYVRTEDICEITFTMKNMNDKVMEMLKNIAERNFANAEASFLTHKDCFFQYMLHQPEEMWMHNVVLYDYRNDGITSFMMYMNRNTSPVVCFISEEKYPQMKLTGIDKMNNGQKEAFYSQLDEAFLEIAKEQCSKNRVSSVFLLGDIFSKTWCKESLKYLCRERRVFQGNNLFSKGACYGAREQAAPSALMQQYVFLSEDKLRANVGMNCCQGQEEIYKPLLYAGENWYDSKQELDLILAKDNSIELKITPLDGGKTKMAEITLDGLKVRGNKTNRVGFSISMKDADTVQIEVTDKGFGEFFPSTGQIWKESFSIDAFTSRE